MDSAFTGRKWGIRSIGPIICSWGLSRPGPTWEPPERRQESLHSRDFQGDSASSERGPSLQPMSIDGPALATHVNLRSFEVCPFCLKNASCTTDECEHWRSRSPSLPSFTFTGKASGKPWVGKCSFAKRHCCFGSVGWNHTLKILGANLSNTLFLPTPHTEPRPGAISESIWPSKGRTWSTYVPDVRSARTVVTSVLETVREYLHCVLLGRGFHCWFGNSISAAKWSVLLILVHLCLLLLNLSEHKIPKVYNTAWISDSKSISSIPLK